MGVKRFQVTVLEYDVTSSTFVLSSYETWGKQGNVFVHNPLLLNIDLNFLTSKIIQELQLGVLFADDVCKVAKLQELFDKKKQIFEDHGLNGEFAIQRLKTCSCHLVTHKPL